MYLPCVYPSFNKFVSFAHILIELLGFFLLSNLESPLHILDTGPLSGMSFTNIFSRSVVFPSSSLGLYRMKIFNLDKVRCVIVFMLCIMLMASCLGSLHPAPNPKDILLSFTRL